MGDLDNQRTSFWEVYNLYRGFLFYIIKFIAIYIVKIILSEKKIIPIFPNVRINWEFVIKKLENQRNPFFGKSTIYVLDLQLILNMAIELYYNSYINLQYQYLNS